MSKKVIMENNEEIVPKEKPKVCFIIMPIADVSSYDNGHFLRVYNHLIKPACEQAGFIPVRADDVSSSHMIVVDILKKIVESDLAICDLSARNPNVLYELGLRQAFNKKTVLIKDNKTDNIFDVQGFRYAGYDSNLRIDNVKNEVLKLSNALTETYNAIDDINSIVQLLKIEPAKIENKTELSAGDTVLFRAISELTKKVESLSYNKPNITSSNNKSIPKSYRALASWVGSENTIMISGNEGINTRFDIGKMYYDGTKQFGFLFDIDVENETLVFNIGENKFIKIQFDDPQLAHISEEPVKL
ncbi:hypothetical protein [Serratia marcescens]|uniref:hypothetical protein n=1 Tax=Serratia marcescens TaxID=615 RepID=UPI00217A6577|nr:hypothetical protein [Serratia marcescens]CAI0997185.1 Uncharacterised protein [Serratia marcescens]